jgi:hypothetical protein
MAAMRILAFLFAALLAIPAPDCAAAPFSVRLGIERIVVDTPPGFTDTTDLASPRLQDLADGLTSASNRILIFALSDADVRRFTNGDQLDAKRYMLAVTPKGLERERVTPQQFATLVADSLHEMGKPVETGDFLKFLDKQPIGKLILFSEMKKEAAVISVLQGTRLPPLPGASMFDDKKPQYQFLTTTLFLMRGKALRLDVYAVYESPADFDWLKTITQRWIDELLRLNR